MPSRPGHSDTFNAPVYATGTIVYDQDDDIVLHCTTDKDAEAIATAINLAQQHAETANREERDRVAKDPNHAIDKLVRHIIPLVDLGDDLRDATAYQLLGQLEREAVLRAVDPTGSGTNRRTAIRHELEQRLEREWKLRQAFGGLR